MNQRIARRIALAGLGLALAGSQVACQEVDQPKTTLTQSQWEEVKAHIKKPPIKPDEQPDPQYPVGANFGDKIKLIGFDVKGSLVAGKKATFVWYWEALEDIEDNWKVFVHFDSSKRSHRQNLDHLPLDGKYQTSRWKKGQIIEDVQNVTIHANYPEGQAVPYIGFYKGQQRLPIQNDVKKTDDRRVIGPALSVKNPNDKGAKAGAKKLPSYNVATIDEEQAKELAIDGKLDEEFWKKASTIELEPFGAAPDLGTKVRVLRTADHLIVGAHMPDKNVWSKLDKRDADTWTEEVLEVFIDPDRDGKDYFEFQINPLGTIFDAHFAQRLGRGKGSRDEQIDRARAWNMEGLETAVHVEGTVNDDSDEDTSWSVEVKIPFENIPGVDKAPKTGDTWATNFYRYDRPGQQRRLAYAWSKPNQGSFHQVERFGKLHFGAKPAAAKRLEPADIQRLRQNLKIEQLKPNVRPTNPQPVKKNPQPAKKAE